MALSTPEAEVFNRLRVQVNRVSAVPPSRATNRHSRRELFTSSFFGVVRLDLSEAMKGSASTPTHSAPWAHPVRNGLLFERAQVVLDPGPIVRQSVGFDFHGAAERVYRVGQKPFVKFGALVFLSTVAFALAQGESSPAPDLIWGS